jgi:hypothetical protein
MNVRQRINGMMAHWAAFPLRIKDWGVAILGKYHGHLVCEYAGESFDELAQRVHGFPGREADIEDKGLLWLLYPSPSRVAG